MAYLSDMGFRGGKWGIWQNYLAIEEQGELIVAGSAKYLRLAVDERLELWTRYIDDKPDIHVHSYYRGDSRFPVMLFEKTERDKRLRSDGAFFCRSKPLQGDGWFAGQLPFVFDAPDYHRYDSLTLPRATVVQITASALHMIGYADEDEYEEANPRDEEGYGWQARHFVPVCMVEPRGENGELQIAGAMVSGFVLDTAIITNPLTELDFCWALVETICGVVDVVCSPNDLEGYLHTGGVVTANCLLTGRILDCAVR
ncbi:MAG: hypothetical protein QOE33_1698 [Acidobacteriota bacterium]|nr:hypothetical protein [Acidobacteriota bacterium]